MSDVASQPDDSGPPVHLADLAYETLTEMHGQSQNRRYVGCFLSQSLVKLLETVDSPAAIQSVSGQRRADREVTDMLRGEQEVPYLTAKGVDRIDWAVDYRRSDHGDFAWDILYENLRENRSVWDIPVRDLTVRIEDEDGTLTDHWRTYIENASEKHPDLPDGLRTGWIEPPFFAHLHSSLPGTEGMERQVTEFHDDVPYYFMNTAQRTDEHSGMGWTPRTLDLQSIWSYRGFIDSADTMATRKGAPDLTPTVIEKEMINFSEQSDHRYGAINSPRMINAARSVFSRGSTGRKALQWTERGEWIQES